MTAKTVYTTTYTCDFCGKKIKVTRGKSAGCDSGLSTFGWTSSVEFATVNYIGSNPDHFCQECKDSFKEWKQSRTKKDG